MDTPSLSPEVTPSLLPHALLAAITLMLLLGFCALYFRIDGLRVSADTQHARLTASMNELEKQIDELVHASDQTRDAAMNTLQQRISDDKTILIEKGKFLTDQGEKFMKDGAAMKASEAAKKYPDVAREAESLIRDGEALKQAGTLLTARASEPTQ